MKPRPLLAGVFLLILAASPVRAEVKVEVEHNRDATAGFKFKSVPFPLKNDIASTGKFTIVEGVSDPNGSSLRALNDGVIPDAQDQPTRNFFFNARMEAGCSWIWTA